MYRRKSRPKQSKFTPIDKKAVGPRPIPPCGVCKQEEGNFGVGVPLAPSQLYFCHACYLASPYGAWMAFDKMERESGKMEAMEERPTLTFGPDAKPWEQTSARLTDILDAGIVAERAKDKPRDYLGMSRLGEECSRKLFYEYTHTPKDEGKDFTGRTYRIFQRGHDCETRMAAYLRMSGFELLTERADGKQFGVYIAKDETGRARIAGHSDGIILGWTPPRDLLLPSKAPDDWVRALPFPLLWENKGVGSKAFKKYQGSGIKKGNPVYYAQMQLYMAYLELGHALFTAENEDTCEIFAELVPFNAKDAQEASDRGARVVSANAASELPRCCKDATDFRARLCEYAERCWAAPAPSSEMGSFGAMPPWANAS